MSPRIATPVTNRLLAALTRKDRKRFLAHCEQVSLAFAEILAAPGERIRCGAFPSESFISLATQIDGGSSLEIGMVGDAGLLDLPLTLGINVSPLHAMVQGEGLVAPCAPVGGESVH